MTDTGTGLARVIQVEVPGQVRVGFEAALGYGPSQWFDLVADPAAKRDLCQYPNPGSEVTEQGSLANHVFYPEDYHAHHISQKLWHPGLPRSATVVEQSPLRVVIETSGFPTVNHEATRDIELKARYALYADGRVAIRSTVVPHERRDFAEWRIAVLGVGDPTYRLSWAKGVGAVRGPGGTLRVPGATWTPDRWKGYAVEQPGWHAWPIASNTADTLVLVGDPAKLADGAWTLRSQDAVYGWIRGIDHQDPFHWTNKPVRYLTLRWDPATPPPFTAWTRASAVMVPWSGNGQTYEADTHSWDGFKRHYVRVKNVSFRPGAPVVQRFLLRLGTHGSSALPDLASSAAAASATVDWRAPAGRLVASGQPLAFDPDELAWTLNAPTGVAAVTVAQEVDHPILRLPRAAGVARVFSAGQPLSFRTAEAADGTLLLLVWAHLPAGAGLSIVLE